LGRLAGEREVRDLVVLEAGRGHRLVCVEELFLVLSFGSFDDRAPVGPTGDRSMRLDGEAVERDVCWREREGSLHVVFPIAIQMRGQSEDEVERNVVYAPSPNLLDCSGDLRGVVCPMHPIEDGVIEALRAE
jgi:hypothetical protein